MLNAHTKEYLNNCLFQPNTTKNKDLYLLVSFFKDLANLILLEISQKLLMNAKKRHLFYRFILKIYKFKRS